MSKATFELKTLHSNKSATKCGIFKAQVQQMMTAFKGTALKSTTAL